MFQFRRFLSCLHFLMLLPLLVSSRAIAQAPARATGPPTLAVSLTHAAPPEEGIALAVGADRVALPKGSAPPDAQASVAAVAGAYGRIVQDFGPVAAVAPPTMVFVGIPPEQANPFDGMPPADVLKLLAGGLDRDQWKLLLGPSGLGLSDLTTQTQRDLFAALFPNGVFKVQWDRPNESNRPEDIRDVSPELPSARLRLGHSVSLGLPETGHPDIHSFGMSFEPAGSPKKYISVGESEDGADFMDGARVREVLPNTPKEGQLDLNAPALKASVPLARLKTVGELLFRIGRLTHTELYPDARFEGRRLTVVGKAATGKSVSAPAADLLRAAAFCLTGTYRKVGPAFVLTDDLIGIGTRRQMWADFEREAAAGRKKALDAAGDAVYAGHSSRDIPAQGNLLALTAEQIAEVQKQHAHDLAHGLIEPGGMLRLSLPFAKLTPAQQEVAQHTAEYYAREPEDERPTLEGIIDLQSETSLQVLLPSVDGPVTMNYNFDSLFSPSMATMSRLGEQLKLGGPQLMARQEQAKKAAVLPLAPLLKRGTDRAVLALPKSAAEVDTLVASLKTLGLNQLWLPVFAGGIARTDTLAEALPEALKVTRGTGIQVFAVLDLLTWDRSVAKKAGEKAGEGLEDRTLRGETSAEAADREARLRRLESDMEIVPPKVTAADAPLAVSPFAAPVGEKLRAVLADLAARPGLAGVVWRDTARAGYFPRPRYRDGAEPLGYTEPARLLFLRARHTDPVDLFPGEHQSERANTRLPEFDSPRLDSALCAHWEEFRAAGDIAFLRALAVQTSGRVLFASRGLDDEPGVTGRGWYGTWDIPTSPPTYREDAEPGKPPQDERTQARVQSRIGLRPVRGWLLGMVPEANRAQVLALFKQDLQGRPPSAAVPAWDGYVLDMIPPPAYTHLPSPPPDPLALLVADLHRP